MVARTGGYYRTAFRGERGVTQGDPLSPTIFNVVVDAVVRHCVAVMVEGAGERGEYGNEVKALGYPLLRDRCHCFIV